MSTVFAPDLYVPKRPAMYTKERDAFLRANREVDVAILADALGLTERAVISYQRHIGVRKLTQNSTGGPLHKARTHRCA